MSAPIALGRPALPLPLEEGLHGRKQALQRGANALSEPTTPPKRLPVVDRSKVDPETLKAAQGMEAMFLDYMLQEMRHTVPKNEMDLESPATEIYRGMMDSETAKNAARAGGIGLADQIVAYLESQRYTESGRRHKETRTDESASFERVPDLSTGGTHAGQPNKQ